VWCRHLCANKRLLRTRCLAGIEHNQATPVVEAVYSKPSVATTLIRRDDVDVKSASSLHLEMVLSRISHGNIVAFPNAADVHVFRSTVDSCQHSITTLEEFVRWEDLLVLLDHDYFGTSG
jgi:hypothetical protein